MANSGAQICRHVSTQLKNLKSRTIMKSQCQRCCAISLLWKINKILYMNLITVWFAINASVVNAPQPYILKKSILSLSLFLSQIYKKKIICGSVMEYFTYLRKFRKIGKSLPFQWNPDLVTQDYIISGGLSRTEKNWLLVNLTFGKFLESFICYASSSLAFY